MARNSTLRASDADRETVAERLHQAAVEGRLDADELEERLHLALRARTYGDLKRLVADLPGKAPAVWRERPRSPMPFAVTTLAIAVRVAIVLVAAMVVVAVFAFTAMWWIVWAIVFLSLRSRRAYRRPGPAWRPPRARRI
jgi:hypothetical protein